MEPTAAKPKVTPKDFFLWLGAMIALYVSATSLILLIHQYINVLFPNQLDYTPDYGSSIRFAIASLIVSFPLFVWLMRVLHQNIRKNPEKKDLWVRRWLVFITLFIAGATIAGDLVALIYTFLNGDLTTRFALKALTILIVLGGGFWYYLQELKGVWETREMQSKIIGGLVTLVVLVSVVSGFFLIGSPETQRLVRLDVQKANDLANIQSQVLYFWQQKGTLPATLPELENPLLGFVAPKDPQTLSPYTYEVRGPKTFALCATFNKESENTGETRVPVQPYYDGSMNQNWAHGVGETCFERTIDPLLFPPVKK